MKHYEQKLPHGVETLLKMDQFFSSSKKWCQGAMHAYKYEKFKEGSASCIAGALFYRDENSNLITTTAAHLCADKTAAVFLLVKVIDHHDLMTWNDRSERKFGDIKKAIQDAITLAYAEQGILTE